MNCMFKFSWIYGAKVTLTFCRYTRYLDIWTCSRWIDIYFVTVFENIHNFQNSSYSLFFYERRCTNICHVLCTLNHVSYAKDELWITLKMKMVCLENASCRFCCDNLFILPLFVSGILPRYVVSSVFWIFSRIRHWHQNLHSGFALLMLSFHYCWE